MSPRQRTDGEVFLDLLLLLALLFTVRTLILARRARETRATPAPATAPDLPRLTPTFFLERMTP